MSWLVNALRIVIGAVLLAIARSYWREGARVTGDIMALISGISLLTGYML